MKLTSLLILVTCLHVSAKGVGQSVTLSVKDASLKTVFNEIIMQSGTSIIYNDVSLKNAKPVTVKVERASVEEALNLILKSQPFFYELKDGLILIKPTPTQGLNPGLSKDDFSRRSPTLTPPPITVRGRIVNEKGESVVASIIIKGTKQGARTDEYGNFEITNVEENATLVISGVTIETQEVKVNSRAEINVTAITKISAEEEVTISTGYWSSSKRKSVMNIAKVDSKDIENQPVTNPLMALQGRMAGVDVTPINGVPGSAVKIQIRGNNSLRVDGGSPLYVVDGVPVDSRPLQSASYSTLLNGGYDPLNNINPANIESIEVLKDGAATAIYGSRGANGVVRITTKKSTKSGTNFDGSIYRGIGQVSHTLDLMNTQQYVAMRKEAYKNENLIPAGIQASDLLVWDTTRYTDWQKELIGGTANVTDIQGNVTGGTGNTTFRVGGAYHKETMVFPGNFGFNRINGQFALNHQSANNKLHIAASINYGLVKMEGFDDSDVVPYAISLPPNAPSFYGDNGELNWENNPAGIATWKNPIALMRKTDNATTGTLIASTTFTYKLLTGFDIKATMGYTDVNGDEISKNPISSLAPSKINQYTTGSSVFVNKKRNVWITEPQLSYSKLIGDHNIDLILGSTFQKSKNLGQMINGLGYNSDASLGNLSGASVIQIVKDELLDYRYLAFYGRAAYNFKEKYMVEFTGRRDGSSRFGPGNQYGNFGGLGVAWIFTQESFMNKLLNIISFGKIRGSVASTGNDQIGDYQYYNTYSRTYNTYAGSISFHPETLFNQEFGWEKTTKIEGAIELGFLNNRFSFEVAYYKNRSSNQLVDYQLPAIAGFASILKNFNATVENSGLEFSARSNNIISNKWKWISSFNISIPKNELVAFSNIETSSYASIYQVGQPLSISNLYTWTGVDPATGYHTFKDVNNNGFMDNGDKHFINVNFRKYYAGLNNTFIFKNLEFSFLLQYVNQSASKYIPAQFGTNRNQEVSVLDHWRKEGDISTVAKPTTSFAGLVDYSNLTQSDYLKTDASFIRLKTLSMSYSLPSSWFPRQSMASVKLFVQGQNLFTVTDYINLDPETGSSLPPLRMLTVGAQVKL